MTRGRRSCIVLSAVPLALGFLVMKEVKNKIARKGHLAHPGGRRQRRRGANFDHVVLSALLRKINAALACALYDRHHAVCVDVYPTGCVFS